MARTVSPTDFPGRLEWPNITFSRGLTDADALFEWVNKTSGEGFAAAGNKITRSTGAITAVGERRQQAAVVVARGRLSGALDRTGFRRRQ